MRLWNLDRSKKNPTWPKVRRTKPSLGISSRNQKGEQESTLFGNWGVVNMPVFPLSSLGIDKFAFWLLGLDSIKKIGCNEKRDKTHRQHPERVSSTADAEHDCFFTK